MDLIWEDHPFIVSNEGGTIMIAPTVTGTHIFDLTITDELGCVHNMEYPVDVYNPLGIEEEANEVLFTVSQQGPELLVSQKEASSRPFFLELYDASGKLIVQQRFINQLALRAPTSGLYFMQFIDDLGQRSMKRLIVN